MPPRIDPTDILGPQPHSHLTALSAVRKQGKWYYVCICDCGNPCTIRRDFLLAHRSGQPRNVVSCGCVHAAQMRAYRQREAARARCQEEFYGRRPRAIPPPEGG